MAINRLEFIVIVNRHRKENNEEAVIEFLRALGLEKDLAILLVKKYWNRNTLGGSIWKAAIDRGIIFNMISKTIEINYKIVPSEKPFTFEKPN